MSKNNSFGTWGDITNRSQIAKEEKQQIDALQLKLKAEPKPELKAGIEEEIAAVKKEYKEKRQKAEHNLYTRP